MADRQPLKLWNAETAIEQLKSCAYSCEGGPLQNNDAFIYLEEALKRGPKYLPGQGVWFEVCAEANGVKLNQWVHFYIVGVTMDSDTERRLWTYSLSFDPPAPYHYGKTHFTGVDEKRLRLEKPAPAQSEENAEPGAKGSEAA